MCATSNSRRSWCWSTRSLIRGARNNNRGLPSANAVGIRMKYRKVAILVRRVGASRRRRRGRADRAACARSHHQERSPPPTHAPRRPAQDERQRRPVAPLGARQPGNHSANPCRARRWHRAPTQPSNLARVGAPDDDRRSARPAESARSPPLRPLGSPGRLNPTSQSRFLAPDRAHHLKAMPTPPEEHDDTTATVACLARPVNPARRSQPLHSRFLFAGSLPVRSQSSAQASPHLESAGKEGAR